MFNNVDDSNKILKISGRSQFMIINEENEEEININDVYAVPFKWWILTSVIRSL